MSTVQQTPQRFLTVADVAATLNCSTDTVRRRIACGDLVAIRLGDHPKAQLLRRARQLRGLTQEQVAALLQPFHRSGKRVGKATISAAEKSFTAPPNRVRRFTADDLVAYTQVFNLPLDWFLNPPTAADANGAPPPRELLRLVISSSERGMHQALRLGELQQQHPDLVAEAARDAGYHVDEEFIRKAFIHDSAAERR